MLQMPSNVAIILYYLLVMTNITMENPQKNSVCSIFNITPWEFHITMENPHLIPIRIVVVSIEHRDFPYPPRGVILEVGPLGQHGERRAAREIPPHRCGQGVRA